MHKLSNRKIINICATTVSPYIKQISLDMWQKQHNYISRNEDFKLIFIGGDEYLKLIPINIKINLKGGKYINDQQ